MATNYIKTEDILVFPSTRRMNKQVSARLLSEQSFANQINKLIETDGFVITPEDDELPSGYSGSDPFEFNIHGYYFYVKTANDITSSFSISDYDSIYGNIYLDTEGNYTELKSIDSTISISDSTSYYQGLVLSSTDLTKESENAANYSLKLFEKVTTSNSGNLWMVPPESRLKFKYIVALGVDGGEIVDNTP